MTKELVEITVKIRAILMELSDDLHKLNEKYGDQLKNVNQILIVIDMALSSIPNVRTFQAGKKFTVKGDRKEEVADIEVIASDDEAGLYEEHQDEEDEDVDEEAAKRAEERRKARH